MTGGLAGSDTHSCAEALVDTGRGTLLDITATVVGNVSDDQDHR